MASTVFKVSAIFDAFDKMSKPIRNINRNIDKYTGKMNMAKKVTARSSVGMVGSIKQITTGIIGASLAYAVYDKAILGTIRRGAELENTLVQAGAKFGKEANVIKGTEQFKTLEKSALQAGLTTEFTAQQSAGALKILAAAGLSLNQSIAALPGVADFATASGLDIERAASISADAIGSFGSNIEDLNPSALKAKMGKMQDIMVITANSFNTTVEEMFEASVSGGRVLTGLIGATEFQFASLIGNIATGGKKGETAGRGIRAAFLKMTSTEGLKGLKQLGVSLTDNNGKFKDVITIISEVGGALNGMRNEAKKTQLANKIFGRVGLVQMDILMGRTEAQLRKTTAAMESQRGEVKRIAAEVRSSLLGKWIRFMSLMEGLGLIIFTKIKPGLKVMVNLLTMVASAVATSSDPLIQLISLMAKLALVLNAGRIAMMAINLVLNRSPWFLMISALISLTILFPEATSFVMKFADVLMILAIAFTATRHAVNFLAVATNRVTALMILQKVVTIAMATWAGIMTAATVLWAAAQWGLNAAMLFLLTPVGLIIVGIIALIAVVVNLVRNWDFIVAKFSNFVINTKNWIKPIIAFAVNMKDILFNAMGAIASKAKNFFTGIFSSISSFLGFGEDEKKLALSKTSEFNINGDSEIAPSPAALAAAEVNSRLDVTFHNKPDDVTVSQPFGDDSDLVLNDSAT